MLHYTQLEIVNYFVTYSCEGNGKFFQNLFFDVEYDKFVIEFWCWVLLVIIDLVEGYNIQNPIVINLAESISTALLSIYQDTSKINIVNDNHQLLINTVKLFKKASKVVYSNKIFKSELISTYINLITLSKMIPNIDRSHSLFFEEEIFPVKKCLNLIANFIKIFYLKCIADDEKKRIQEEQV